MEIASETSACDEPIDAVYLWVDSSDARWRAGFERTLRSHPPERAEAIAPERFRQHDELRYSLRSLEKHAPWIRRVHLVTAGQCPRWLDRSQPRLQIWSHEDLFRDPACLPCFNSHAIELQLHRIPGLSRRFLFLNDDVLLGRDVLRGEFVTPEGRLVLWSDGIPVPREPAESLVDRALAGTAGALRAAGIEPPAHLLAHGPQICDRTLMHELELRFAARFASTSASRFRSSVDLVLRVAHTALALAAGAETRRAVSGSARYSFVILRPSVGRCWRDLRYVARRRPQMICFNDDLGTGVRAGICRALLRWTLPRLHPAPSSFERPG